MKVLDHSPRNTSTDGSASAVRPVRRGRLITFEIPMRYAAGLALQQRLHAERLSGRRADMLVLLQHLPVYTVGRRTKPVHLGQGMSPDIPIEPVCRGGSVTYHGPGQLVGYPILALSDHAAGPRTYIHKLEEVLIRTLACWDIAGYRVSKAPGVWIRSDSGEAKIASIGARIDHGITLHGFALNVDLDLAPFAAIVPCGMEGCRMTSIAECMKTTVPLHLIGQQIAQNFSSVFQLEWADPCAAIMLPTQFEERPTAASGVEA